MKPTQFLYSESLKDQKPTKSQVAKSIAELRPLPKTSAPPKDNSMIYSLVSLPVKQGQAENIILPESLIANHTDPKVVIGKNTEIARSIKKLRPINLESKESTPSDADKAKSKTEANLQGPKQQVFLKALNDLTNGAFKKTQSHLLFGSVEQKIKASQVLCLVRIQGLKFFNEYNPKNEKIPSMFSWEVVSRKQSLLKTTPKDFNGAEQDLLDFVVTRNAYENPKIILWKIKNNDEKYIGEFELENQDFLLMREVLDYKSKTLMETQIEKSMFRAMQQTKSYLGDVSFQLIQLGVEHLVPINSLSGIPGSPRTDAEKLRHRLIDLAMSGQEYRWHIDPYDRLVIEVINSISQETDAIHTIEEVQDALGQSIILMESKYPDYTIKGRSGPIVRRMKKEQFEQMVVLIAELNSNGVLTEVQTQLRRHQIKGRVTAKHLQDALQSAGCTANELLLYMQDDMGVALIDFMLMNDDLPSFLEALNEIKLIGEDELALESVSDNLFKSIGRRLRLNKGLRPLLEFIKALEKKPEIAVLIHNYSYAPENMLNDQPPFLLNFDPRNYEHVMVLSKINKLNRYLGVDTPFTQKLVLAHTEAKKQIYFEIPCFPKDKNLEKKEESLRLRDMGWNIFHEVARRRKWAKTHQMFETYPEWFFEKDVHDVTPFQLMLEKAPFDVVKLLFTEYPEQIARSFKEFQASEVPEIRRRNDFMCWTFQKQYKTNLIHTLLLNEEYSSQNLLDLLNMFEEAVNQADPNNFEQMKRQRMRGGDYLPLTLFMEKIRRVCKKKLDRITRESGTVIFIIQKLMPEGEWDGPNHLNRDEMNFKTQELKPSPLDQQILAKIISKLPEQLFQLLDNEFTIIEWVPKLQTLSEMVYVNLPTRDLVKHKQQNKLFQVIQKMNEDIASQAYDPSDPSTEHNQLILYNMQILLFMFMEIRDLRSNKLDVFSNQLIVQLQEWVQDFAELIVQNQPMNLINSHHGLKVKPKTFFNFLNAAKYNLLLNELSLQHLNRLDIALLKTALGDCLDLDSIKEIVRYALQKDPADGILLAVRGQLPEFYKAEEIEKLTKERDPKRAKEIKLGEASFFIQFQDKYQPEIQKTILDELKYSEVEALLNTHKADKILPLLLKMQPGVFISFVHQIIINYMKVGKSLGVTAQNMAVWIQQNKAKVGDQQIKRYLDYFRNSNMTTQMHTLINLPIQTARTYFNQSKVENYVKAQGKNWAVLLEFKKFALAIKDNSPFININETLMSLVLNGFIEKVEALLPFVKSSEVLRKAINCTAYIANRQIFDFMGYLQSFSKPLPSAKMGADDTDQGDKGNDGDGGNDGDDGGNGGDGPDGGDGADGPGVAEFKPASAQKSKKSQKSKSKNPEESQEQAGPLSLEKILDEIMKKHVIKTFDPTVYHFRSPVKSSTNVSVSLPKFPEGIDSIRQPPSLSEQLTEMSSGIEDETDQYLKSSFSKPNRIKVNAVEDSYKRDLRQFYFIKNWKSSFVRMNVRSIFSSFDHAQQSYKKTLSLLIKQYHRFGQTIGQDQPDTVLEQTLRTLVLYNLLAPEQILFQLSKTPQSNTILLTLLETMLYADFNNMRLVQEKGLYQHYQQKNFQIYLNNISKLIKGINVKKLVTTGDQKQKLTAFIEFLTKNLQLFKHKQDNGAYKLTLEAVVRLEAQLGDEFKNIPQDIRTDLLVLVGKAKNKDKYVQALIQRYNVEEKPIKFQNKYGEMAENEKDSKDLQQLYSGLAARNPKQICAAIKKINKLNVILEKVSIIEFLGHLNNDKVCEEVFKELFKLNIEKDFKLKLIEFFNADVFNELCVLRMSRTYSFLINNVWFKTLLGSDVLNAKLALKALKKDDFLFSEHYTVVLPKSQLPKKKPPKKDNKENKDDPDDNNDGAEQEEQDDDNPYKDAYKVEQAEPDADADGENKQEPEESNASIYVKYYTILSKALGFRFYEFVDTLIKLGVVFTKLQINLFQVLPGMRVFKRFESQNLARKYEQLGFPYVANGFRLYQHYLATTNNPRDPFTEAYIVCMPILDTKADIQDSRIPPAFQLIQRVCSGTGQYWMPSGDKSDTLTLEKKVRPSIKQFDYIPNYKGPTLLSLKVYGADKGIRFHNKDTDEKFVLEEWRKLKVHKGSIPVDLLLEQVLPLKPILTILNDPVFSKLVGKHLRSLPSRDLCINTDQLALQLFDPVDRYQMYITDPSLLVYFTINFPAIILRTEIKAVAERCDIIYCQLDYSLVYIRSFLQNDPKLFEEALRLFFKCLCFKHHGDADKKEDSGDNDQPADDQNDSLQPRDRNQDDAYVETVAKAQPKQAQKPITPNQEQDEYIEEEYESEEEREVTDDEDEEEPSKDEPKQLNSGEADDGAADGAPEAQGFRIARPPKAQAQTAQNEPQQDEEEFEEVEEEVEVTDKEDNQDDDAFAERAPARQEPKKTKKVLVKKKKPKVKPVVEQQAQPQAAKPKEKRMKIIKVKVTKTRRVKKPKQPEPQLISELKQSLLENSIVAQRVFVTFLMIALANEDAIAALQKLFIEYKFIKRPPGFKEIDQTRKNRLIKDGFKEPFDQRFVDAMELKAKELKGQQLEDLKHIKEVLQYNEQIKRIQYSELFQVILEQIFSPQNSPLLYTFMSQQLQNSAGYKVVNKRKNDIFQVPFEKDERFFLEVRNYFRKQGNISQDFVQLYFANYEPTQLPCQDKWVQALQFLRYGQQLLMEMVRLKDNVTTVLREKVEQRIQTRVRAEIKRFITSVNNLLVSDKVVQNSKFSLALKLEALQSQLSTHLLKKWLYERYETTGFLSKLGEKFKEISEAVFANDPNSEAVIQAINAAVDAWISKHGEIENKTYYGIPDAELRKITATQLGLLRQDLEASVVPKLSEKNRMVLKSEWEKLQVRAESGFGIQTVGSNYRTKLIAKLNKFSQTLDLQNKGLQAVSVDIQNEIDRLIQSVSFICEETQPLGYEPQIDYNFKCKATLQYEGLVFEHRKELKDPRIQGEELLEPKNYDHHFIFDVTVNIWKAKQQNKLHGVPYGGPGVEIRDKYADEIVKTLDSENFDFTIRKMYRETDQPDYHIKQLGQSEQDRVDLSLLFKHMNNKNFRKIEKLHEDRYFINETIEPLIDSTRGVLLELKQALVDGMPEEYASPATIMNQQWEIYSDKVRPELKLRYQDKVYPVLSYSNYQTRNRSSLYKQSVSTDLTFPELYPLVNLQTYTYIPDIVTEEVFKTKNDTLALLQQACFDLNTYAATLNEFVDSLPDEDEEGHFRMQLSPQIVQWPIVQKKIKTKVTGKLQEVDKRTEKLEAMREKQRKFKEESKKLEKEQEDFKRYEKELEKQFEKEREKEAELEAAQELEENPGMVKEKAKPASQAVAPAAQAPALVTAQEGAQGKGNQIVKEQHVFKHVPESHSFYLINLLRSKTQLVIPELKLKFTYNTLAFTEIILFKLARILQSTTGRIVSLATVLSIFEEWAFLRKVLVRIGDLITDTGQNQENDLDKFKFYYVEVNEVHQNTTYQVKSKQLDGMDAIFRFGKTEFYVHSNVLVIRLNVAVVSDNCNSLISGKNAKLRSYESSISLLKEDKELRAYLTTIVTLEEMLKQIFTKK